MAAAQHPFVLPNPLAEVGKLIQGAVAAAQSHLKTLQAKQQAFTSQARLPPRIVVLPRLTAAIIPGDSTAELVLTNGLNNFL
jgi:YggT family protein